MIPPFHLMSKTAWLLKRDELKGNSVSYLAVAGMVKLDLSEEFKTLYFALLFKEVLHTGWRSG